MEHDLQITFHTSQRLAVIGKDHNNLIQSYL